MKMVVNKVMGKNLINVSASHIYTSIYGHEKKHQQKEIEVKVQKETEPKIQ